MAPLQAKEDPPPHPTTTPPPASPVKPPSPLHRRRCCILGTALCVLTTVVLLLVVLLILVLTLLKPKDPTTTLVSAVVTGVSPSVSLPNLRFQLNLSLSLEILVRNPNRASFSHAPAKVQLYYRETQVGDADVADGRIPARGEERMRVNVTVEAEKLAGRLGDLLGDVLAGEVGFDTAARIPGRVTILGIVKRHAVAVSSCHVVVGFPSLALKDQQCSHKTKL